MDPKVSVILPCCNGARFIRDSIESVLGQRFQDYEFILVDDCSTDDTREIMGSYRDPRIRLVFLPYNHGTAAARNAALKLALGEYIAPIDADDIWLPHKLERQVACLDDNPDVIACFTFAEVIDENQNRQPENCGFNIHIFNRDYPTRAERIRGFFWEGNNLCHPSALVRRSFHTRHGGYRVGFRQLHDFDLWLRMLCYGDLKVLPEKLIRYRYTTADEGNLSRATPANTLRLANEIYVAYEMFFEQLSDDLFVSAFRDDFLKPGASTPAELVCERYFLLRCWQTFREQCGEQMASRYLISHYEEMGILDCLQTQYHFSVNDFYVLLGKEFRIYPAFISDEGRVVLAENQIRELTLRLKIEQDKGLVAQYEFQQLQAAFQQAQKHLADQARAIEAIQQSTSWRLTKPLRAVSDKLRGDSEPR